MNVKARVRANILYHFANSYNCLVFGTSNLSETLLGYGTKYGDLAADLEIIEQNIEEERVREGHPLLEKVPITIRIHELIHPQHKSSPIII